MSSPKGGIAGKISQPPLISLQNQQKPQPIQSLPQGKRIAKKPTKPKKVPIGSEIKRSITTINGVPKEVEI